MKYERIPGMVYATPESETLEILPALRPVVDGSAPFFVQCELTNMKLEAVCKDCRGVLVSFSTMKEHFENKMAAIEAPKVKPEVAYLELEKLKVRFLFEIAGELSSLSHSYRELLKIQQVKAEKK